MDIELSLIFLVLATIAEILGTVGGFGSSVFFVPMASYFLEPHEALGLTAIFHVMSNLTKLALFPKSFDRTILLYLGIPSLIFVLLGAYLTQFFESKWLTLFMAIGLIIMSLWFLLTKQESWKSNHINLIAAGQISGLMAGLIGTGGAIRGMALTAFNLEKNTFIATSAFIDLFVDSGRAVVYYNQGYVNLQLFYLLPVLLVSTLLGTWIGKQLLQKLPQQYFRNIVLLFILFTGIYTLIRSLYQI